MYKVLVIEDEELERTSIKIFLEENIPEIEIVGEAKSGYEALEIIDKNDINLLLVDINIPGIDGIEVIKYARKKLYEHYREQYLNGKKASQRTIAEGLADLYYDFKQGTPEVRFTWNILKTLKNIRDYVNALRSLNDVKIALLFAATDAGVMRAFNITETK